MLLVALVKVKFERLLKLNKSAINFTPTGQLLNRGELKIKAKKE
jgi:hypothetical protein